MSERRKVALLALLLALAGSVMIAGAAQVEAMTKALPGVVVLLAMLGTLAFVAACLCGGYAAISMEGKW